MPSSFRENPDGSLSYMAEVPGGEPVELFRCGIRADGENQQHFAISYGTGPGGDPIEWETIRWRKSNGDLMKIKRLHRERPNRTEHVILLFPDGQQRSCTAQLVSVGYTQLGGEGPDPREPHARLEIKDPQALLSAFTGQDLSQREDDPNRPGLKRLIWRADPALSMIATFTSVVNGRNITVAGPGEITLLMKEVEGLPPEPVEAYVRALTWK